MYSQPLPQNKTNTETYIQIDKMSAWDTKTELSTLPHSAGASRNFIENSGISRNRVSLPPGVIISRICEILPRLDCLPLISWPSARKYIDLTSRGYQSNRDVQDFSVFAVVVSKTQILLVSILSIAIAS